MEQPQAFQPAPQQPQQPPQQAAPPPPAPIRQQSFLEKIKANKTGIMFASVVLVMVAGMSAYIVSPARKTIVAPATIERPTPAPASNASPTTAPTTHPSVTPAPISATSSWKTYNSAPYGYSLKYPPDWTVRDLGSLEPKVPNYVVFNAPSASASARDITISLSIRSYAEELALNASGSAVTVSGIIGTKQAFKDSDGNTSTVITIPRAKNLLVLRSKTAYLTIFNQILTTFQTTK